MTTKQRPIAWIATSPSGTVLHLSERDGWTVHEVMHDPEPSAELVAERKRGDALWQECENLRATLRGIYEEQLPRSAFNAIREALQRQSIGRLTLDQMMTRNGLYGVGDTNKPGFLVPVYVKDGEVYAMTLESKPLRRNGWHPSAIVCGGPILP